MKKNADGAPTPTNEELVAYIKYAADGLLSQDHDRPTWLAHMRRCVDELDRRPAWRQEQVGRLAVQQAVARVLMWVNDAR